MENIYVDEYVRTKDGFIGKKVKDGLRKGTIEIEDNMCSWITDIRIITKHSFDIIDLIEIGDYVNGKLIIGKEFTSGYPQYEKIIDDYCVISQFYENDVKSIVTKEVFASVEYKVKEN